MASDSLLGYGAGIVASAAGIWVVRQLYKYLRKDPLIEAFKDLFKNKRIQERGIGLEEVIGEGHFGEVRLAMFRNRRCAVKMPRETDSSSIMDFFGEADKMKNFEHDNVMRLIGVVYEPANQIYMIVLPYMENGSLRAVITGNNDQFLRPRLRQFALDAAQGLEYLAGRRIVHKDIALRNCLVDANWSVKISDFGLAREAYYTQERNGPQPWMSYAPECLVAQPTFRSSNDVWAFGVLLYSLYTRDRNPVARVDFNNRVDPRHQLRNWLERGNQYPTPRDCPDDIETLMRSCWELNPRHRPTFTQVCHALRNTPRELRPFFL